MGFPGRHRFQVGPSTFTVGPVGSEWWVNEVWWQMINGDDKEDCGHDYGPFPTAKVARDELNRLKAIRERRT